MPLPPPTGPFRVGSVTHLLQDPGRACHIMSDAPDRKLLLKLWYPAAPAPGRAPEILWNELRVPGRAPWLIRRLLMLVPRRTDTYPWAPLAALAPALSPVIYNHGLISFASENTSLMQELASRGHVVTAIEHVDQLLEWEALNRQQPLPERRLAQQLTAQIRRADAAGRARLAGHLYATSSNTRRIVIERARDTLLVLDSLASILATIPGAARGAAAGAVQLVGYSVGGAVATEVAARDRRAVSVVNLDGGLYGPRDARLISVPYLMMYSAGNVGINDDLLPRQIARATHPGTNHLSYHDVAGLLPLLRWVRAVGPADPMAVLKWRNQSVAEYLHAVRGGPLERTPASG
jgi:dienelactone hydrolase